MSNGRPEVNTNWQLLIIANEINRIMQELNFILNFKFYFWQNNEQKNYYQQFCSLQYKNEYKLKCLQMNLQRMNSYLYWKLSFNFVLINIFYQKNNNAQILLQLFMWNNNPSWFYIEILHFTQLIMINKEEYIPNILFFKIMHIYFLLYFKAIKFHI